jgi:hypothetical protein
MWTTCGASARAGSVTAAAVYLGSGREPPSLALPVSSASERCPRDTWPCRSQPTSLRGFEATTSSCTNGRRGTPVCAAVGRPVSAATLTRTLRGCTAPPRTELSGDIPAPRRLGNALTRTLRLASPIHPPRGSRRKAPAPLRSARAAGFAHPHTPFRGLCGSLIAPASSWGSSPRRPGLPLNTGIGLPRWLGRSACTSPSAVVLLSLKYVAM